MSILGAWRDDATDVAELATRVERLFGNSWIENEAVHSELYRTWASFREEAIERIGGQTMNERLYSFGLFEKFDACASDTERREIYAKLLADPDR